MAWVDIGGVIVEKSWNFTNYFEGNLIKVNNNVTNSNYIYQALAGLEFNLAFLKIRVVYSSPKSQIFLFPNITILEKRFALKNISRFKSYSQWLAQCYVWDSVVIEATDQVQTSVQSLKDTVETFKTQLKVSNQSSKSNKTLLIFLTIFL